MAIWLAPAEGRSKNVSSNVTMLASASTAWVANTLSAIIPYRIECAPVPLLPTVPPTVARLPLAGSGPSIRPCGLERGVEMVQHDAWLAPHPARLRIDFHDPVQVFTCVYNQGPTHRLPGQAGAGAAGRTGTPCCAQTVTVAMISSTVRGMTTPMGSTW